jgi:hypothetical protein
MTADIAAWAGVALMATGMMAGMVGWIFRTSIKPLKVVIENNTDALNQVSNTIIEHAKSIADHEGRIIEIETTHEILGCKNKRRKEDRE